jgi:hypothetical protein
MKTKPFDFDDDIADMDRYVVWGIDNRTGCVFYLAAECSAGGKNCMWATDTTRSPKLFDFISDFTASPQWEPVLASFRGSGRVFWWGISQQKNLLPDVLAAKEIFLRGAPRRQYSSTLNFPASS